MHEAQRGDDRRGHELAASLLPRPRLVEFLPGDFVFDEPKPLADAPPGLERPEALALAELERELWGPDRRADGGFQNSRPAAAAGPKRLQMTATNRVTDSDQAYRLTIQPDRVLLEGPPAGLFHGIQTLRQIARLAGRRWPCLRIEDAPDFAVRATTFDISRGRVPTLATLFELADRLAALKANQLQLYTEHTFAFPFNPEISAEASPLTPDEIRRLDAYCADRRIELVPSLAVFGHMGRILSLPSYRHLAEIGTDKRWDQMSWRERVRGLTLDVTNPESRQLVGAMLAAFLPAFRSGRANVCCDETFDLGKGRGRGHRLTAGATSQVSGAGALFLRHLLWLREECGRYGKRVLFWGDMVKHYPELLPDLPRDAVVLNWGYEAGFDYESTRLFRDAGLETWVCPGTSGWNRFVADINTADANVRGHAEAGRRLGAAGLLQTEWGDDGHVAPLGAVWPTLAAGAVLAWNAAGPGRDELDAALGRQWLGQGGPGALASWRRANEASNTVRIWPAFYAPLPEVNVPDVFDEPALENWERRAEEAAAAFAKVTPAAPAGWTPECHGATRAAVADRDELMLAFRLHGLAARRLRLARRLGRGAALAGGERNALADACLEVVPRYAELWLRRHKPAGLDEVLRVFKRLGAEVKGGGQDPYP